MIEEHNEVIERSVHPSLDNPTFIMKIKSSYCTIGYNARDVEKISFYFQNKGLINVIIDWIKFRTTRKAYL